MTIQCFLRQILFAWQILFSCLTLVSGEDQGDGEANENWYGDGNDDMNGFFNYQDAYDWSDYAIYPKSCIMDSDGDYVVFDIYGSGNNNCKKKSVGTYKSPVQYFVKAYVKQKMQEAEQNGGDYDVDQDALNYLMCQQFVYNNNYFFVQVGCRDNGKGFQIHTYSDQYCTERMANQNYNLGIDTSSLMVGMEYCKNCVYTSQYGGNNNNNNANGNYYNNNNGNNYYDNAAAYAHDSPLCGAAWNYKETCNRKCKRLAKNGSSSSSSSGGSHSPFSPVGKAFLWMMSFTGFFFLLAGLAQRKRLTKSDAVLEDAAIRSAGIDKKFIPRIIIAYALFIIFLILFKRKILTWFFLTVGNIGLLWYYCHLQGRNNELKEATGEFQMYKADAGEDS